MARSEGYSSSSRGRGVVSFSFGKARLAISKKYAGKSLYIAFPMNKSWYLIEHDKLVDLVRKHTGWLDSKSWQQNGHYNSTKPNRKFVEALAGFQL